MLHDKYEFIVSFTIVYVNVTWQVWIHCEFHNCLRKMLHDNYEFFVSGVIVHVNVTWQKWIHWECNIVRVNVTWQVWINCELPNCLCKCSMTSMNYLWVFHNCSCECYMTSMNSLWVSQLFMLMLHDKHELFVSFTIVYVNVTWQLCILREFHNCLC
jgi:hypothetical protein